MIFSLSFLLKCINSHSFLFSSFHLQQTRNPDYYDISPRPFGAPGSTGLSTAASGFTRSKAIRPIGGGFVPSQQSPVRANVPHQQTQFLAHFNEPVSEIFNTMINKINSNT